eukprot:scaffold16721_cov36-Attheya_sp.AAC.4
MVLCSTVSVYVGDLCVCLLAVGSRWWDGSESAGDGRVWGSSNLKLEWGNAVLGFVWGALLLDVVVTSGHCIC